MIFRPDHQTFINDLKLQRMASVRCTLPSDLITPVLMARRLGGEPYSFLLESIEGDTRQARYSIFARRPLLTITCSGTTAIQTIHAADGTAIVTTHTDPLAALRHLLEQYRMTGGNRTEPYSCGLIGYFSYDFARFFEILPDALPDPLNLPVFDLMLPAEVLIFDHLDQEIRIFVNTMDAQPADYVRACGRLQQLRIALFHDFPPKQSLIQDSSPRVPQPDQTLNLSIMPDNSPADDFLEREAFEDAVRKAKVHICDGDIFQIVLSRRLRFPFTDRPLQLYRALRKVSPSPYLFCLQFPDLALVGASPEMLVRVDNGRVETSPIAGTRPRGVTAADDQRLERELMADEKELSEHAMLVDLSRNDIGRISLPGTVTVDRFCVPRLFSHVMHLVSEVSGVLDPKHSLVDVLGALLPAGTLSGAPKIRAMELIDELEPVRRGPYGGSVGYLGFDGRMDTCITIRTALLKDDQAYVQIGAGIVYDSDPAREFDETSQKAAAMLRALSEAALMEDEL